MIVAVVLALLCSTPEATSEALPPEALGAPPQTNSAPTAWACSVETLKSGRECVFEAEVAESTDVRAQSESNVRALRDIGHVLCLQAAKPPSGTAADKNLVAQCERKYSDASEDACGLEGKASIVDAKGRFAPSARACYRKLSEVLQEITTMATVASACCQCAQQHSCPGAGVSCLEKVSHQDLTETALACLSNQCGGACDVVVSSSSSSGRDPRQFKPGRPSVRTSRSL